MTIMEAIAQVDSLVRNTYGQKDKIGWLSRLDWIIKTQIIDSHQGAENVRFNGYDDKTDLHTTLLVPPPFDEIYLRWMEAQIHYHNGEYGKYNALMKYLEERGMSKEDVVYCGDDYMEGGNDHDVLVGGIPFVKVDNYEMLEELLTEEGLL